jgi:hypothetical protein
MNTIFGWSRNGVILLLLVAAIVLTALAGLFLLVAGAAGALAVGGVGPLSAGVLLLGIVVLLVANFVLLVILMRCSCRSDRPQYQELESLLPLLFPMVGQLPNALRDMAIALKKTSDAVGWIQGNIRDAGELLNTAGGLADTFTITVPTVDIDVTYHAATDVTPAYNTYEIRGFNAGQTYHPLRGIKDQLAGAGADLKTHTDLNGHLDEATRAMKQTASLVGLLANGLGAAPPTPDDVTVLPP